MYLYLYSKVMYVGHHTINVK